ncbi:MAG: 50S ribosomal protein L9 [Candidatus Krumholzibacteria bacterium]|nr:50S ribosomal protein L9 [Candidatus Krumholzibacteria bacterium]
MEVILLDAVPSLGDRGDTVKVKPGYARNHLFPIRLALPATASNRRVFGEEELVLAKRDELAKSSAQVSATKLTGVSCTIPVQVGDEDKLYGSVTANDIAKVLKDQGFGIDKKQVLLEEPIKQLGVYTIDVKLHREISAPIKVWVVKE